MTGVEDSPTGDHEWVLDLEDASSDPDSALALALVRYTDSFTTAVRMLKACEGAEDDRDLGAAYVAARTTLDVRPFADLCLRILAMEALAAVQQDEATGGEAMEEHAEEVLRQIKEQAAEEQEQEVVEEHAEQAGRQAGRGYVYVSDDEVVQDDEVVEVTTEVKAGRRQRAMKEARRRRSGRAKTPLVTDS